MNVIVSNNRRNELNTLSIDVIKSVEGEYTVEELIGMFTNFFFNRMIIDVTAIKDYGNMSKLQKFAKAIDVTKVIVYLGDLSVETSKEFVSDLISIGIYNFTNSFDKIMVLFNKPNTYEDVKMYHYDTSFSTKNEDDREIAEFEQVEEFDENLKIIGVQNLTEGAGATTLVVQMVKQLNFNYKTIGIELNKQDFIFFMVPSLYSCTSRIEVVRKIKEHSDRQIVIIDLNQYDLEGLCNEIIYLVEPSTIKLTKLIKRERIIFDKIRGSKIVLNKSMIDDQKIGDLEAEIGTRVFKSVKNFNDRSDRVLTVDELLVSLGFTKQTDIKEAVEQKKKFSFFGKNKED